MEAEPDRPAVPRSLGARSSTLSVVRRLSLVSSTSAPAVGFDRRSHDFVPNDVSSVLSSVLILWVGWAASTRIDELPLGGRRRRLQLGHHDHGCSH